MANTSAEFINNMTNTIYSKEKTGKNPICSFYVQIINKIQKIPVAMHIDIQKKIINGEQNFYASIKITSSKIFYETSLDYVELYTVIHKLQKLSVKAISIFLKKVKSDLEKLKFDKFTGKFILNNHKIQQHNIGIDIFGDKYSNAEECCVCYEKTLTETNCSHRLCIECWSNIKKKKCPICREFLCAKYENVVDSSDDEN